MDNLTHAAVGLFLSRAGFNRLTPRSTAILVVAANAPDVDVLSFVGGPLTYLHFHRYITHSIAAAPVMAFLSVLLVRFAGRKPISWVGAMTAAIVGVASHLLLDFTNIYGIRLFLPFSSEWLRLDLTSVIDLWIWFIIAIGIAAPFLGRLVGSEVSSGALRPRYHGRAAAIFALTAILLYDSGRAVLHTRAIATLDSRLYEGVAPSHVTALPDAANPLRWHGIVETPEFFAVADLNLAGDFDPGRAAVFEKPDPDPAIDVARRTPAFQRFLQFCRDPLWRIVPVPEPEGAREVQAIDLRFGTPADNGFAAKAVLGPSLKVLHHEFTFGRAKPR